jgi:hypothetical protein
VFGVRDADACMRGLAAADDRVYAGPRPPAGWRTVDRYVVLPSLRRPGLLVPVRSGAGAAAAGRQFLLFPGRAGGIATGLAALALRTGLPQRAGRDRLAVAVAPDVAEADLGRLVLRSHLAETLAAGRIELAVRVGATRPNGKPVVQVSRPDGRVLAYAKVGWNDLTRPLVAAEADALRAFAARGDSTRTFRVARLLHSGEWRGNTLTVVEPLTGGAAITAPDPPRDATHELALGGAVTRSSLGESGWWEAVRARIEASDSGLGAAAAAIAAEAGERPLSFGRGHGDWTPWNMRRIEGRLVVWDWERAADGVPIGIDAMHYGLLVALNARKLPPPRAVADTLARAPGWLAELDQPTEAARVILCLELLEMSLRYAEARRAGVTVRHDRFGTALHNLLDLSRAAPPVA